MTFPMPLKIAGLGRYLPSRVVSSEELERRFDQAMPPGWIVEAQGVRERRWVDGETSSWMAAQAAREALAEAGAEPGSLDLILNASGTAEQAIPDGAPLIQRQLGLAESGVACFSVHATCLSFLVGLELAASLLQSGRFRRILLVSSEITSCALNFAEIESSTLFGDGAAAALLVRPEPGESNAVLAARFETYGEGAYHTQVAGGGTRFHPNRSGARPEENLFQMDGRQVFRLALKHGLGFVSRLRGDLADGFESIKLVIPHQSSKRALGAHPRVLGIPADRMVGTLAYLGNCVAASIPLTLYEAARGGRLTRGDRALLFGTGAGLSLGGIVLSY